MSSESLHGWLVCLLAAVVAAPLVASAAVWLGIASKSPRTPAVAAMIVSLLASLSMTYLWNLGSGEAIEFGDRLGGGSFVCIDGITVVLMPYVSLVQLTIVLVAPNRFLDTSATVRILLAASATFALFSTAHPLAMGVLWIATALPTWISTRNTPGGQPAARVFAIAILPAIVCLAVGTLLMVADPPWAAGSGPLRSASAHSRERDQPGDLAV